MSRVTFSDSNIDSPIPPVTNNDIILNEYQIESVYKIINEKTKHGLVLWWSLGSGKSIASLAYIMNVKKKSIIVCSEKNLFIWKNEIKKLPKINDIYTMSHDNFSKSHKTFINEIIIIDDAHNLKITENRINSLSNAYKIILLTGTPIYNATYNLANIVNLAAGKNILPYTEKIFKDRYYENVNDKTPVIEHITGIFPSFMKFINSITRTQTEDKNKKDVFGILSSLGISSESRGLFEELIKLSGELFIKNNINIFGISFKTEQDLKNKYENGVENYQFSESFKMDTLATQFISFYYLFDFISSILSFKMFKSERLMIDVLSIDIHNYINVAELNVEDFPDFSIKTIYVEYEGYQLDKLINVIKYKLDIKSINDIRVASEQEIENISKKIDIEEYKKYGSIIGDVGHNKKFCKKFHKILKKARGKKAVFYSSYFTMGTIVFKKFLNLISERYLYLSDDMSGQEIFEILEKFRTDNIFLLLHPIYTEGINIIGAEQLHIIEPMLSYSKKEQLMSRVLRFGQKGRIEIFQWACVINTFKKFDSIKDKINYMFGVDLEWIQKQGIIYNISPDYIILQEEIQNKKTTDKIRQNVLNLQDNDEMKCCIKFPSKDQEDNCLSVLKKHCE